MMSYNSKSCSTAQALLPNFHRQHSCLSQTVDVPGKERRKQGVIQEDECVCPRESEGRTNQSFCHLQFEVHTLGLPNPANHLFTFFNLGCSRRRIHLKNVTLWLKLNPQRAGTRGKEPTLSTLTPPGAASYYQYLYPTPAHPR